MVIRPSIEPRLPADQGLDKNFHAQICVASQRGRELRNAKFHNAGCGSSLGLLRFFTFDWTATGGGPYTGEVQHSDSHLSH
jgi:hypothetical protein